MNEFMRNAQLDGDSFFWQGGATGILLIHGFTATTAQVRLLANFLQARNYTVAAPLLPGHLLRAAVKLFCVDRLRPSRNYSSSNTRRTALSALKQGRALPS